MSLESEAAHSREPVAHLQAQLQEVLALVGTLRGTIEQQQAHIAKLVKMTFGRRSERIEGPTLLDAFADDPTPPVTEPPKRLDVPAAKRTGHGRKPKPATLPRRREEVDLSDAEKVCPCCAGVRVRRGETIRERLDDTPAVLFIREIACPTYVCRRCEQAARDPQFQSAAVPPEPVPKSGVGAGLLAQIIVSKSVDHLPLDRQESIFAIWRTRGSLSTITGPNGPCDRWRWAARTGCSWPATGGLRTAAVLMSLCASLRRHGGNPWAYLTELLDHRAAKPADVTPLLPDVWAQRHRPAAS